jgi:hypothetical protein
VSIENVALHATHSHLFSGTRLSGARSELSLPLGARPVTVCFSNGIEVDAEIVVGASGEDCALVMPTYETATGHPIPAALWPVTEVRSDLVTDQLILKLGRRLLPAPPNRERGSS